jgi:site-specific DNA-methyltransferase (adenine-specific)
MAGFGGPTFTPNFEVHMEYIPISKIVKGPRQRQKMDPEKLQSLKASIAEKGLIHAIHVRTGPDDHFLLNGGERRFTVISQLHVIGHPIFYGTEVIPPDTIPAVCVDNISDLQAAEIEFDENCQREDISWQERTEALARIYDLKQAAAPEKTQKQIAAEIVPHLERSSTGGRSGATEESSKLTPETVDNKIRRARLIQKYMDRPEVKGARSEDEAYRNATKFIQDGFTAELARRRMKKAESATSLVEFRKGDLFDIMPKLDEGTFDGIFTDPPYGYGGQGYFPNKTAVKHSYNDDLEYAKNLYRFLFVEGFRVCKPKAHLFLFCKHDMFGWLLEEAKRQAWSPFPLPIMWDKGPGYAPWGNLGFRNNYETIFWAVKGQRGLRYLLENKLEVKRVTDKEHAAEKPVELMKILIEAATLPNDYILDPCMGSGSTIVAAKLLKRRSMGVEIDEGYYNMAVSRVANEGTTPLEKVIEDAEGSKAEV